MKTNSQIRDAQVIKATAFIKRAFKNEDVKPQGLDVTDKGTHLEVYVIGNKKFAGHLSDYEMSFNIKKGAITELSYMSPSVNMDIMVTQNIVVGARNQIANFAKSCEKTANELNNQIDFINDVAAEITQFNNFVFNVLLSLEEAAADGEFELAPANEDVPAKKVSHKQAVANSKAAKAKAAKAVTKPASKKTELVAVSKRGRVAKVRVPVAKPAAKAKKAVAKKAAKVVAKPASKAKKAVAKVVSKKVVAKPAKKADLKNAAAKKAAAKKAVK